MPSYYPYKQGVDGSGIVERSDAVFDGYARP